MPDFDILIAGGGPVGGALALALAGQGRSLGLIETRGTDSAHDDPRPLALSHGTRLILERLNLWQALGTITPITGIHVSQRGGFGRVALTAGDAGLPALGYVVDYAALAQAVTRALAERGCAQLTRAAVRAVASGPDAARAEFDAGGVRHSASARLLVVADGGTHAASGEMQTVDYGQAAVTARVSSAVAHHNVAYERFTPEGPLALLPSAEKLALVWTTSPERAQQLCVAPESAFLSQLHAAFGDRLGRFTAVQQRAWFPLALKVAQRTTAPHLVAIGNAAQTLHPVAGQGLNLGLRDAWELAMELAPCAPAELGAPASLARYAARRRLDRGAAIRVTDTLVRLFSNDSPAARCARGLGLAALGAFPPARDFFARRMVFGARG